MTRFQRLMRSICDEAETIHTTISLRPELVGDDGDLNDWARDVLNELHDMTILLSERGKR